MTRIAISYRRSDSASFAGRIRDHLTSHFGDDSVFMDTENIPVGVDFRRHIENEIRTSDLVLAIVGPEWLSGGGPEDRIGNIGDPVRVEIETALVNRIQLIPVLLGDSRMPDASRLPDSIRDFAFINAARIDQGRDFRLHMSRLVADIEKIFPNLRGPGDRPPTAGSISQRRPQTMRDAIAPQTGALVSRSPVAFLRRFSLVSLVAPAVLAAAALGIVLVPSTLNFFATQVSGTTSFATAGAEHRDVILPPPVRDGGPAHTGSSTRPSFPCQPGISAIEQAICDDALLAAKDRMLNELFILLKARANPERGAQLAEEQRKWRYARNQCREPDTVGCLRRAYETRIDELKMGPSFDCARSRNAAERSICTSFVLATKDQLLAEQYRALMDRLGVDEKARVREGQRRWLKVRDACAGVSLEDCIGKAYDLRFAELIDEAS